MHRNMTGEPLTLSLRAFLDPRAQKERPPRGGLSENEQMSGLGCCECSVLPLPAPAKQTHRAKAGGEEG
jgi:hypothetical protein